MTATPKAPAAELSTGLDGARVTLIVECFGTFRLPPADARRLAQSLLLLASEAELHQVTR